jgi:nicotinate-nucleotide adenylyltransferase
MSGRKGILGGTFNPPHVAHLIAAHEVRETLSLDRVVLVPTARHPFKGDAAAAPKDRAAMAELATAGDPGLAADRIEVDRGGTSYTIDTLRALREREPDTEWFLIVGADALAEFHQWREAERIAEIAHVVVITRGDDAAPTRLPFAGRSLLVPVPALQISSTAVRDRIAAGRSVRYWVPPGVEAYIRHHGLYGGRPEGAVDPRPPGG